MLRKKKKSDCWRKSEKEGLKEHQWYLPWNERNKILKYAKKEEKNQIVGENQEKKD